MSDAEFFASVGGKLRTFRNDGVHLVNDVPPTWDFGYLAEEFRTPEEQTTAQEINDRAPRLAITGRRDNYGDDNTAFLWDAVKKINAGQHFENQRQESGCCVGINGGQVAAYTAACDVAIRGDFENALDWPFWLLPYGESRRIMGARGKGVGSLGGAMAEAVRTVGFPPFSTEGLPVPDRGDGVSFGERVEVDWSYSPQQPKGKWQEIGKQHPMQTTAKCTSSSDVREALRNGYACTQASMWGGDMRPAVKEGVLLNRRSDRWSHQMGIIGWWDHPRLGEIFYILNSWGPRTHGTCPSGAPPGGFWVLPAEIDFMCADEVFAYSGWQGFVARNPWYV